MKRGTETAQASAGPPAERAATRAALTGRRRRDVLRASPRAIRVEPLRRCSVHRLATTEFTTP